MGRKKLNPGDTVQLMGIHRSIRVPCDDPNCTLIHRYESYTADGEGVGRYHIEDGPREGVPATVLSTQPASVFKRAKAGYANPGEPTAKTAEDGTRYTAEGAVIADIRNDDHWDSFPIPGAQARVELLLAGGTIVTADSSDVKGD